MTGSEKHDFKPEMLFGTFYPEGFIVALTNNPDLANKAKSSLELAGFTDVYVFTSQEVLANHESLMKSRTIIERIGAAISSDERLIQEDYLEQVHAGKLIITVYIPDSTQIEQVRQLLIEQQASKMNYYGNIGVVELSLQL